MVKELKLENNIKLVLKQVYTNGSHSYVFKLCCKLVANLHNPCPKQPVAIKVDKCVEALGSVFCIEQPIVFNSQTINVDVSSSDLSVTDMGGYYLIYLNTDSVEHENKLCVNDICFPVKPDCLDDSLLGQCADLDLFVRPVFAKKEGNSYERFLECAGLLAQNQSLIALDGKGTFTNTLIAISEGMGEPFISLLNDLLKAYISECSDTFNKLYEDDIFVPANNDGILSPSQTTQQEYDYIESIGQTELLFNMLDCLKDATFEEDIGST